jgi:tryptophanyl-tRNA synthetase
MAADILLFDANVVPVGKDQKQHLEMCADIAQSINSNYKEELLTIPEAVFNGSNEIVQGLDGRKMSKSYNNTIALFTTEKKLQKTINKIVTNSQELEEPKDPDTCNVFSLYKLFSTEEEQAALAERYRAGGMGWGHAKKELFEKMNETIAPMRDRYNELMEDKTELDKILAKGAEKAREIAAAKIVRLRKAMGID